MSDGRRDEFRALVKAAHDAIDEYAERRTGVNDWFVRDLQTEARLKLRDVLNFGLTEKDTFGDRTFVKGGANQ
jgi:hypothetical protein